MAEDMGVPRSANGASQRAVNTTIEHLTPVLTGTLALGRAQRADLLQLAVLHAMIGLREERIRTDQELDVALTAALVIDNTAQIASIGLCRTYLFRPGSGLTQLTTNRLAAPKLADDTGDKAGGSLDQEKLLAHGLPESGGPDRSSSWLPSEVSASEVDTQAEDLLLLTSPKLWQSAHQAQVESILHDAPNARNAARSLAREVACQPEGQDCSVVVVRPREGWMPGFGIAVARPGTL
jgi:serine/threonine protein phosphatase PrpC